MWVADADGALGGSKQTVAGNEQVCLCEHACAAPMLQSRINF